MTRQAHGVSVRYLTIAAVAVAECSCGWSAERSNTTEAQYAADQHAAAS